MAITAPPDIDALPNPPDPNDRSTFNQRAYPWSVAQQTLATQLGAVADNVFDNATEAATAATTATTQAGTATSGASTATTQAGIATTAASSATTQAGIATTQAGIATTQAGIATTQAGIATTKAAEAAASVASISSGPVTSVNGQTGVVTLNAADLGAATIAGAETLTNKTLAGVVLNDGYTEEVFAVTGTTPALSASNGSIQTWTFSANSTPTDSLSNGQSLILGITASSFSVTWPSITWSKVGGSGTAPTLTSTGVNWVILWKTGGTLRGAFLGTA